MAADRVPKSLRVTTFVMVVAAVAAVEVGGAAGRKYTPLAWVIAVAPVALAVVAARFAPRPTEARPRPRGWAALALLAAGALPFALSPSLDKSLDLGRPLEMQMLTGFAYVALGLAALGAFPACVRLAVVSALFLMLFALALGDNRVSLGCLGVFSAAGVVWLFLGYRAGLRTVLTDGGAVEVTTPHPANGRVPWAAVALVALLVVVSAAVVAVGPKAAAATLWELVPSSGGTGKFDRNARGGVNDGDEETSGKNADATGMVDTEQFLESPLPSLYDALSDTYGKPHKPKEGAERAQALSAIAKEKHGRPTDGLRPSPTFPASRNSPTKPRAAISRAARALFEVEGRTPLHVRAAVFDEFDGRVWFEAAAPKPSSPHREGRTNWMTPPPPDRTDAFADDTVRHTVKVAKLGAGEKLNAGSVAAALDGTLLPTPPHVGRFKLGKIEQVSFFSTGSDGILRMAGRTVPGGVGVETDARVQDPRKLARLGGAAWVAGPGGKTPHADRLNALAREWAADAPRGWPQIAAVVRRLRSEYAVDDTISVPPDHPDAAAFFLFESKRGPDYLFATSAGVLLRELGYRTRLVAGFYAAPEMYDPETRHTPVGTENVHVWPEVQLAGNVWLVLEPTPGYDVMAPPTPWHERAVAGLLACGRWVAGHPIGSSSFALTLFALVWWRRSLVDAAAVARWRLRSGPEWRGWACAAVRLVERRAAWSGRPRPAGETAGRYFATLPENEYLVELARVAEWANYAPADLSVAPDAEVWAACDRAVRAWTLRRFQRLRASE